MTGWIDKETSTSPVATPAVAASAAGVTPFCDAYCVLFFDQRLHTIACDMANHRDPILPRMIRPGDAA